MTIGGTGGRSPKRRAAEGGPDGGVFSDIAPASRSRSTQAALRRARILEAALAEFSDKGFASARMEDVARRAGVAKGTIYLNFADKRALFAGIVELVIGPAVATLEGEAPRADESVHAYLSRVLPPLAATLAAPPRRDVIRLLIAEGARFPEIAEIYFHQIVERGLSRLGALARMAQNRSEPGAEMLETFPQLVVAPAIMGVILASLFEPFQPLDVEALVSAQIDLLLAEPPR